MPRPANLDDVEILFSGGYFPSTPSLAPEEYQRTIKEGSNVWLRSGGRLQVANGLNQVSATNVGARIFAADIQRAVIAGALSGSRLPFAGLLRYRNAVLFFLSEETSAQLYLNETAVSGVTTSPTAGRLRVAVPTGGGAYDDFDAGFDKPLLASGDVTVTTAATGFKPMSGAIGVAVAPWRTKTDAVGPPSETIYNTLLTGSNLRIIRINLPAAVSGQDGWIYCGTRWRDESGALFIVRQVYITPRGTFTATNASPNLTAGVGTFWNRDLRRGDQIVIGAEGTYTISDITSDTTAVLTANFTGSTAAGKTMTIDEAAAQWFDSELEIPVSRELIRPPRAAGVLGYAGRVLLWGCAGESSSSVTGPAIFIALINNPEHVAVIPILTASGSDLVNVLGGDGPLYLMTTTSLEVVDFTGDPDEPYKIRIVAEPGFVAVSNGVLYKDTFYGFNNRPLRTRAEGNIDVEFAEPVWEKITGWNAQRVIVAVDPKNEAILYIYDDGAASVAIPYMAQLGRWSPPLNFSARIIDAQVVNGKLYVTYLSGGNYRVNEWEAGAGIGGTRFAATQYYDRNAFNRGRLKNLAFSGKAGTLRVYAAMPDAAVPDVSNSGASAADFTLSDTLKTEPEIHTNLEGKAYALRVDFASNDGRFDKLVARGLPRTERR